MPKLITTLDPDSTQMILVARLLLMAIAVISASGSVLAQKSTQLDQCMANATTQMAMNLCAGEELKRSDADLTDIYRQLLAAARDVQGAVEKIRAAENAWIAFRDAYINAMYPAEDKQAAYGSIFPMEVLLLQADLTQQQTSSLREMLKHYQGSPR